MQEQIIGDIILDLNHWDCECNENYIKTKDVEYCKICGARQEEQPNSRINELKKE